MNTAVEIVEVGPRDGLQSEPDVLPTAAKVELVRRLVDAGVRRVEVASFVNPKRVPQMADAEAVLAALPARPGVQYVGLVLNRKGFDRAWLRAVPRSAWSRRPPTASRQRNQGATVEETIRAWEEIAPLAHAAKVRAQITISVSFGCPFEGEVPAQRVVALARRLAQSRPIEIAVADTIGVAVPVTGHDAGRATARGRARPARSVPLPQHTEYSRRQRVCSGAGRSAHPGCECRWNRGLSVRSERDRKRCHRGLVVHVVACRLSDRPRPRAHDRHRPMAAGPAGQAGAWHGSQGRWIPQENSCLS